MKKLGLIYFFLTLTFVTYAQFFPENLPKYDKKHWHFGFTLGINQMNFSTHPVDRVQFNKNLLVIEALPSQGFNIGIVANKRLAEYLDVRFIPTLSFGERQLQFTWLENDTAKVDYLKRIESTFIDFPITFKYKSKRLPGNFNNIRAYVLGGARYSIDLASQKNKNNNNENVVIKLNPNDFLGSVGVGFDFYLPYFKFGVELQMAYGFKNILAQENNNFSLNIDKLTSKMMWITFTFE